jgi:hypothetical protein
MMSIKVLSGDEVVSGSHFRVSWAQLEIILQGKSPFMPLVGMDERIATVKPDEHGVLICVVQADEQV